MGTFRSLHAPLPCERCHVARRTEIQFKTGWDRQERYEVGEEVPPESGLKAGVAYEGNAERYCVACLREWSVANVTVTFRVLAELSEAGSLRVRLSRGKPFLGRAEIEKLGADKIARARANPHEHPLQLNPGLESLDLVTGDGRTVPNMDLSKVPEAARAEAFAKALELRQTLLEPLRVRTHELLVADGWPHGGDWLREDLRVQLDSESRIGLGSP